MQANASFQLKDCIFTSRQISLQQLRNTSPSHLCFTIDGVKVGVPLIMPKAGAMPLLYGNCFDPDQHALSRQFGSRLSLAHRAYISLDSNFSPPPSDTAVTFIQSDMPQNNLLSPKAPRRRFKKLLADMDLPFGFRVDKVLQTSAAYCFFDEEVHFEDKREQAKRYGNHTATAWRQKLDMNRSAQGHTTGFYWLMGTQTIGGIPIWGNYINDDSENTYTYQNTCYAIADGGIAWLRMTSEKIFDLLLGGLVEPTGIVMDDTPIAPLQDLMAAVNDLIARGELRSIDSIELGYSLALRLHQGVPLDPHTAAPANPAYMIVPTWRVNGYALKDGWKRFAHGLTEPNAWERRCAYGLEYELRFNAISMCPWNNPIAIE